MSHISIFFIYTTCLIAQNKRSFLDNFMSVICKIGTREVRTAWRSRAQAPARAPVSSSPQHMITRQPALASLPLERHLSSPAHRDASAVATHASCPSCLSRARASRRNSRSNAKVESLKQAVAGSAALRASRPYIPISTPALAGYLSASGPVLHATIRKLSVCYVTYRDSDVSRRRIAFLKSLPPSAGYWLVFSSLPTTSLAYARTTTLFPCVNNPLRAQRSPHSTW